MYVVDSFSTSIIAAVTYGYEVLSDDDPAGLTGLAGKS